MSVFDKLREITANKPYQGFTQLSIGYHRAVHFRKAKNKFENSDGQLAVIVELRDQILYLPRYFSEKLTDANITELNDNIDDNKNVYLYFGGKQSGKTK